jgi:WD40 repeat protein
LPADAIASISWSRDSKSDALGAPLFEATGNGELLTTFHGHTGLVTSAVFSPDGRRGAHRGSGLYCWPVSLHGQIETLSGDELLKLEAQIRPHMNEDTDYARVLRWRAVNTATRTSFTEHGEGQLSKMA